MTTLRQIWRGAAARSDHSAADRRNTADGSHCFYTHPAFPEEHFAFVPWTVNISSSLSLNTFVLMQHFSFSWLQNRQLTANSTATSAPLPHWTHQHIICITAEIRFHFHSLFSSSLNHRLETKWNSKNIRLIWQSEYLLELNWSRHYVSKGCLCLHSTKRKNRPHSPGVNTRIHYTNHLDDFTAESTKKQTPPNVHWMHRFFGTTVKDVFKYPWTERDWNVLDLWPKRTATQRKPYNNKHNQTLKSLWHLQLKLRVFTAHI